MCELNGGHNRRILIVDDNRSIHDDFHKILCRDAFGDVAEDEISLFGDVLDQPVEVHYELHSAYQGQEGLSKVIDAVSTGHPYAVAFVDMRMPPGWDGLETITRLWEVDPVLQIVICTAFSDYSWSDIAKRANRHSQLLILKKPFDNAEVSQLAASLTEKWDLARRAQIRMDEMERMLIDRTKKIEDAYRETESLLASISSVLVGVNESGIVVRWNSSAEEFFDIRSANAIGSLFDELDIEWDDTKSADRFFNLQDASAVTGQSLKVIRNGFPRVLGASRYPVSDNGVNRGVVFLGMDITDRYHLELQLQQAQKLEAVGQLAAGIAHEINTPMQYLGDNLKFLQNKMIKLQPVLENAHEYLELVEETSEEVQVLAALRTNLKKLKSRSFMTQVSSAMDDSRDGVEHVSRIVRAMKEFAHPGQEDRTHVNLNRALESTIAVSTNEWKCVAVIEKHLDASIPVVLGFPGELNQVFLNILVNAAHAIGETNDGGAKGKGTITVSTKTTEDVVEVSIADSGSGIPDKIKQRIFDPFFTTKEVGKGTGQGLAIAHSVIVQKHGGTLLCESTFGVGTTFYIRLPIEPSDAQIPNKSEPAMAIK